MEPTKILVVDDEEEICQLTKNFLTRKKYQVFTANNSQEALVYVKRERPQLVLLDIMLGDESGMDVLRQIKSIDKSIKVIMVTALDDAEVIQKSKSLGADDYAAKPFTADYLNDVILNKISHLSVKESIKK